ncbi:MAG: DNA-methyltransferase [Candidatus Dormibacteria bacterium]
MSVVNKILFGDCRESMRQLIVEGVKVQMCVTSPPYWGLRNYGVDGQLGNEKTPDEYVQNLVEVFSLVYELLADDGTAWLNIGDTYAGSWGNAGHRPELDGTPSHQREKTTGYISRKGWDERRERPPASYKLEGIQAKELVGIPWMVAFALRKSRWRIRQDIIWAKTNPMPESIRDRCTRSHEYLFLLTKSGKYYFDDKAIAEPLARPDEADRKTPGKFGGAQKHLLTGKQSRLHSGKEYKGTSGLRNKRDVWMVSVKPYKGSHSAVFPVDLIEPCILAGSRPGDVVFDPFMGSGTTAQVAIQYGRKYLGCELNPEYKKLQDERIEKAEDLVFFGSEK